MGKRKSSTGGAAAAGAGAGAAKRKKASGKAPPGAAKDGAGEDWTLEWHADGASACLTCDVDQETSFMGSAEMMVTRGVMRVMGREVGPSSRWVHLSADPRCGGALPLEAVAPTALGADGEGRGVRAHGSVSAEFRSPPGGCEASFRAQRVGPLGAPPPERMFRVPPEWQEAAAAVTGALNPPPSLGGGPPPPVVVVVCGSKGVGKSTLCQVVCNTLLNACPAVAFLDTDLGQPEFTVPGQVSLHVLEGPQPVAGPAHTHPRAPARAHFVGDTSPASHPELYLEAVAALHRWYRSALGSPRAGWMPLVVNTHGWIKGAGLDLLVDLLRLLAPSHVLQVNAPQGAKNLPEGAFWTEGGGGNALGEGEPAQPPPPGCSLLHVKCTHSKPSTRSRRRRVALHYFAYSPRGGKGFIDVPGPPEAIAGAMPRAEPFPLSPPVPCSRGCWGGRSGRGRRRGCGGGGGLQAALGRGHTRPQLALVRRAVL